MCGLRIFGAPHSPTCATSAGAPECALEMADPRRPSTGVQKIGALVEHHDVPLADHGYDMNDLEKARESYALIARQIRRATQLPPR